MPFDWDDPYTEISCTIKGISAKAVKIEDQHGNIVWVPRSCVHGGDDTKLVGAMGSEMDLKVRQWFAEKEGLI